MFLNYAAVSRDANNYPLINSGDILGQLAAEVNFQLHTIWGSSVVELKRRNSHDPLAWSNSRFSPCVVKFHVELPNLLVIFDWCLQFRNSLKAMFFLGYSSNIIVYSYLLDWCIHFDRDWMVHNFCFLHVGSQQKSWKWPWKICPHYKRHAVLLPNNIMTRDALVNIVTTRNFSSR